MINMASELSVKGFTFSRSKMLDLANKMAKEEHQSLCELYDYGYLDSPSSFDSVDTLNDICEFNPFLRAEVVNMLTGSVDQSPLMLEYLADKHKDIPELKSLAHAARYSKFANDMIKMVKNMHFPSTTATFYTHPVISVAGDVSCRAKFVPVWDEMTAECLEISPDRELYYLNLNEPRLSYLKKQFDIPDSAVLDMSHEQDVKYFPLYLCGSAAGDRKAGKIIRKQQVKYKEEINSGFGKQRLLNFDIQFLKDSVQSVNEFVEAFREEHKDYEPLFLTTNYAVFTRPKHDAEPKRVYNVAYYAPNTDMLFQGFGGEFVKKSSPMQTDAGLPLFWTEDRPKFVEIERDNIKDWYSRWSVSNLEQLGNRFFVKSIRLLELDGIKDREYARLVSDICLAVVCARCNEVRGEGYSSPSEYHVPESISGDSLEKAVQDAERLFETVIYCYNK